MEYYVPNWEEIEDGLLEIARRLVKDNFLPDVIAVILTGGMIPAKLLSDILNVKEFSFLDIRSYRATEKSEPILYAMNSRDLVGRRVLILDDVSDTGETLILADSVLRTFKPKEIRSATVYVKPWTKRVPEYYYKSVDKWIVFPWDKWEVFRERKDLVLRNVEKYKEIENSIRR
ncbi:MAG: phosphoribosyltransferase [Sulfolobaceae archaeon]|nr:phosphoribosyltransferase [Sulfolobales archaeon]